MKNMLMRGARAFLADIALNSVVVMLLVISFLATWRGLSDFVSVKDASGQIGGGAGFQALVFFIVLALTLAMYVALREVLRWRTWRTVLPGVLALALYGLLALWSVGFGYGFWWSVISGDATSTREFQAAVGALEKDTQALTARLQSAETLMRDAAQLSQAKAAQEASAGSSCGVSSGGGEGRLFRARMDTNAQVALLAESVAREWSGPLQLQIAEMRLSLAAMLPTDGSGGAAAGRDALASGWETARRTSQTIMSEAQARGAGYSEQLRAKAALLRQPPEPGGVPYCYDPDLASALELAADAMVFDDSAAATAEWSYSGGQAGVARAIEDFWRGVLPFAGSGAADGGWLRDGRSIIALVAAVAVDAALLVFTVLQAGIAAARAQCRRQKRQMLEGARAERAAVKRAAMEKVMAELAEKEAAAVNRARMIGKDNQVDEDDRAWMLASLSRMLDALKTMRAAADDDGARRMLEDLQDRADAMKRRLEGA